MTSLSTRVRKIKHTANKPFFFMNSHS